MNFPLREPLVPVPGPDRVAWTGHTQVAAGVRVLPREDVEALARRWTQVERGVIVCGPETPAAAWRAVVALAEKLGWPVLADPLSGLRTAGGASGGGEGSGHSIGAVVVDAYDVFLRFEEVASVLEPELIVRFGAMPVSKPLLQYLERWADVPQVIVDEGGGWRDPTLAAAGMLHADPAWLCRAVLAALPAGAGTVPTGEQGRALPTWARLWRKLNEATRSALRKAVQEQAGMFEGRVFQELAELLPAGAALYVGNSMPVRDMDAFFPVNDRPVQVFGNRGASGIDGVVSSALGVSAVWDGPVVLALGDLSFYHDLNGLLAAKLHRLDVTIIVVNNDGGGIFSFLPQAEEPKHFERLFGTPIGLDFEPAVRMYGGRFVRAHDWDVFRRAVAEGVGGRGLHVVEVVSERARNAAQHRAVFARAREAVSEVLAACMN